MFELRRLEAHVVHTWCTSPDPASGCKDDSAEQDRAPAHSLKYRDTVCHDGKRLLLVECPQQQQQSVDLSVTTQGVHVQYWTIHTTA